MMQFKDKLKEIRKLKEWSQQQFADKLEEKRSTYAEWENGTIPSFDIVVKIATVSGVSILEFVATIDEKAALSAMNIDMSSITKYFPEKKESIKPIQLKTANGELINVTPDGDNNISLLNAFLLERDRVIDNKQDRIEELRKDKDQLFKLLNSGLNDLSKVQKATFAMVRTGLEYEAAIASRGEKKKEAELLDSLTKLNHKNLKLDAVAEKSVVLSK